MVFAYFPEQMGSLGSLPGEKVNVGGKHRGAAESSHTLRVDVLNSEAAELISGLRRCSTRSERHARQHDRSRRR